ncbi:hypothetical protein G7Z17_g1277 [Cylindrodendrum hubeiense]|uniref:Laccase n=1 Tax=Cylindrodendrum hubeiense TaxID=595255 RepID=A0A9P5HN79_9HYPO|nr:hypothetical protein G7Z17_g1277 [Cylindrodendrum hubeiense]
MKALKGLVLIGIAISGALTASVPGVNYTEQPMDTGVTREYWLELTDMIVAPDGVPRRAMAVNGSIPGPTLFADWGDTLKVHVTNKLTTSLNGTSIHFHGIRQNYTSSADGVTSITQCPLAVGQSTTYTWKALQYGSTWYHSHFGLQAWEGVFGGIIINGPATANYDEDLGVTFLNDWDHETADAMYPAAQHGAPTLDNGLINGTNVYGADGSSSQTGSRFNVRFQAGTSYRLRLVNAAIDTHFKFSIDDHTIKVIASDLVPIQPYETTVLNIGMGQRYDIIITADQARKAENFWMRAIPQVACSLNSNPDNIKGIVYYGRRPRTPSTIGYDFVDSCDDETDIIVPYISKVVSPAKWNKLEVATGAANSAGLFRWLLNSTTMVVDWRKPTLQAVIDDNVNYAAQEAIIELDEANKWVYFMLETTFPAAHPIHLHEGFALQFIERKSEIAATVSRSEEERLNKICKGWDKFQNALGIVQDDSGV